MGVFLAVLLLRSKKQSAVVTLVVSKRTAQVITIPAMTTSVPGSCSGGRGVYV